MIERVNNSAVLVAEWVDKRVREGSGTDGVAKLSQVTRFRTSNNSSTGTGLQEVVEVQMTQEVAMKFF